MQYFSHFCTHVIHADTMLFAGESDKMVNMDLVSILFERQAMPYVLYKAINEEADDEDEVRHYATLVGKSAGERMLLYRD